ncbi:MAG: SiaB family protein kinase [Thermodesulfobacteriota bacterium]
MGTKFSVSELFKSLRSEGIIFCFCGSASQLIVEGIGETLLQRIRLEGTGTGVVGKVFQVFVEQMQNIVSHSAERITDGEAGEELRVGIVLVGKEGDKFYVRCGNFVENEKTEALAKRLQSLQVMTKDELKSLYREERRKADLASTPTRSGLGLIDMARKASEPIDFEITPVDETRSFFSMTAII